MISVIHFSKFNTILYNLDLDLNLNLNLNLNATPKKSTEHTEDTEKNIVKDFLQRFLAVGYPKNPSKFR